MTLASRCFVFVSSLRRGPLTPGERSMLKLMRALKAEGAAVHLICETDSPMLDPAHSGGIDAVSYRLSSVNLLRTRSRLRKYLRRHRPPVVHSIGTLADVLVRGAAWGLPVVTVSSIACDSWFGRARRYRPRAAVRRMVQIGTLRWADVLLADCAELEEALRRRRTSASVVLEPPTVDLARVTREAETAPSMPQRSAPLVGYAGSLKAGRGLEVFANAARLLLAQGRHAEFVIAGRGEAPASLTGSPVRILGPVERLSSVLARLDVCCFPLTAAGTPTAFLEAAALGRPIVATTVPGVGELFSSPEEVLLVPPGEPAALADAIAMLLDDPERAGRMATAARGRAVDDYSSVASTRRLLELYRRLCAGRDASRSWKR